VAVLEIKAPFALQLHEWQKARFPNRHSANEAAKEAWRAPRNGSYFDGNANRLIRQAANYSRRGAHDVALFDWRRMFVADFVSLDAANGVMDGVWFEEPTVPVTGRSHRALLLGFLLRALWRHGIIVHTPPPFCFHAYLIIFIYGIRTDFVHDNEYSLDEDDARGRIQTALFLSTMGFAGMSRRERE
jgi:hypothetical protein